MREIIFRAWDGKKLSIGKAEYFDDSVNFRFEHFDIDCDKPILEQYTGLKDKNGRMIFEGDLLSFEMPDETCVTRNLKGVVYFTEGVFWVDCTEIENDDEALYMLGMFDEDENAEIIGNIHELKEDV